MATRGRLTGQQTRRRARRDDNVETLQRQYLWNAPNGQRPDFSETYRHGDEILISWNALNNSIYDLWLTSWAIDSDPVALCLARAVNLSHDGNLKLVTSDPPADEFASETKYVLRFKPPTGQGHFAASDPDLTSPGFLFVEPAVNPNAASGNVTGAEAPSPTRPSREVATTSATTSTPTSAANTSSAGADETVPEWSPGAAAGLTIGLILAVALLVAMEVAYFIWRRKRRRGAGEDRRNTPLLSSSSVTRGRKLKRFGEGDRGLFMEVDMVSPELPGESTWGQRLVHELQGSGLGRTLTINSSLVELEAGRR
ncbi:hypothetical protein N658DRAFT_566989 [Parathielavia hyrcaniae]|uniref:Uncharacterized protein n=1 Tax=Parathielavia hyrcaniae TaxID=113614 RepID=A0AAN6T266_9PEZI|nr:hypothetical protein N658DRAFT_566989 [Parathielavia hyrcaniae]